MKLKKLLSVMLAGCLLCSVVPTLHTEAAVVTWSANKVNSDSYTNGDAILFTPEFGKDTLPGAAYHDYSWWRVIVCDYDFSAGCYKVISINNTTGNGMSKTAIIPKNGFAIADCYGSDFDKLVNVKLGDEAHIYNLTATSAKITFGGTGSGTEHKPEGKGLEAPVTNMSVDGITAASKDGYKLKIENFDSSLSYYLIANDSTTCDDGVVKLPKRKINKAEYTIPKSAFNNTNMLTVYLWAEKDGAASPVVRAKMVVMQDSAFTTELSTKKIVAFGDSLTAFTGWVKGLLTDIGTDVINSGVGGDNTNMGKARFEKDVLAHNPDICIINFGMNDQAKVLSSGKSNISIDVYKANIEYFIKELQSRGCEVVLVTPHAPHAADGYYAPGQYGLDYSGGYMDSFCDAVRDLAKTYGCGLVDINKKSESEDKAKFTALSDGIHCSVYGHSKYQEWISEYLLSTHKTAGDINGDGKADNSDLSALKNAVGGGTDDNTAVFDFNRNGQIDVADYLYLKRHIDGSGELRWNK